MPSLSKVTQLQRQRLTFRDSQCSRRQDGRTGEDTAKRPPRCFRWLISLRFRTKRFSHPCSRPESRSPSCRQPARPLDIQLCREGGSPRWQTQREQRQGSAGRGPLRSAAGIQGMASRVLVQDGEMSRTVRSPRRPVKATGPHIRVDGGHPRLQSATAKAKFRKSRQLQVQTGGVQRARRQHGPLRGR